MRRLKRSNNVLEQEDIFGAFGRVARLIKFEEATDQSQRTTQSVAGSGTASVSLLQFSLWSIPAHIGDLPACMRHEESSSDVGRKCAY
jgi:hypothetical protein